MNRDARARTILYRVPVIIFRMLRAVTGGICVILILTLLFSDNLANIIMANAIGPEDLELPIVAYPMRQTAEYTQTLGGQGLGLNCSLPWGVDEIAFEHPRGGAPVALRMRQACVFHDYCYRHGAATYGYTQADCDYMLQEQAFRLCSQINRDGKISSCETEARKLTLGVRIGGARSFKRADADLDETGSTYFEFDPYPLKSPVYQSVRVADTPADWRSQGASAKAYYLFSIKQSGMRVRIVATGNKGRRFCQAMDLFTRQDIISVPPQVVRSVADRSDWFVWWRRKTLDNTDGTFAGIRPATASLRDWENAFGAAKIASSDDCRDALQRSVDGVPGSPVSVFVDFKSRREQDGWQSGKTERYVPADTQVAQFVSQFPGGAASRRKLPLALYGLTTHACDELGMTGSCVGEVEIDPSSSDRFALYEPYVANDARCIKGGHRLSFVAEGVRHRETCDRYRNYTQTPILATRHGRPELVWTRRGNSAGDDYSHTAVLRRSPRRDSDDKSRGAERGGIDNFDSFSLDDYPEELEPSALVDGKLVSVRKKSCDVELVVIKPRKLRSQFDVSEKKATPNEVTRLEQLDASWLERPWRVLEDGTLLFLKTTIARKQGQKDISWDISLSTASLTLGDRRPRISKAQTIATIHSCKKDHRSDARWVLQTSQCFEKDARELARGREESKRDGLAAKIMRSAPIVVADIDAENAGSLEDIAFFYSKDGRDPVILKGHREGADVDWRLQ